MLSEETRKQLLAGGWSQEKLNRAELRWIERELKVVRVPWLRKELIRRRRLIQENPH